jgi:RNA polymerase sigma-70 factor (ECF subfamily)
MHRDRISDQLESLVTRYAGALRSIAARYRLTSVDHDDLVQEVRVRLWRALDSERMEVVPTSYLYRTATSAALDLIRRRRASRQDAMEDLPGIERSVADAAPRPDQAAQLSELAAQLERALEAIPESRRRVVRMYLVGYNSTEIGALMGWSEAKARNLLYRGLGDLRERLADVGVGPGPQ